LDLAAAAAASPTWPIERAARELLFGGAKYEPEVSAPARLGPNEP